MKIDTNTITKLAALSKLELSEEEKTEFSSQLSNIVEHIDKIHKLDTENIKPTDQVIEQIEQTEQIKRENMFREDIVKPSMNIEKISKMAPAFEDNMFIVPQIIE